MTNIISLKNNDQIRLEGVNAGKEIQVGHTLTDLRADFSEKEAQALASAPHNVDCPAFAISSPAMITADYEGKEEDDRKRREAIENAPLVRDGDTVEIEGELFIAKVIDRNVADPVYFKRADAPALVKLDEEIANADKGLEARRKHKESIIKSAQGAESLCAIEHVEKRLRLAESEIARAQAYIDGLNVARKLLADS